MSASREKKQRTGSTVGGPTEKERRKQKEDAKSKQNKAVYIGIAAVAVVLVGALLVWDSGLIQSRATAATVTVGDTVKEYSARDVSYFYYQSRRYTENTARMYAQYGIDMGYDADLSPADQTYSETQTYDDYFKQSALDSLKREALLLDEAAKAGYTLSADGLDEVNAQLTSYKSQSAQNGLSYASYIKAVFGPYETTSSFQTHLTNTILANEYAESVKDGYTYTDQQIEDYYKENAATLDSYNYRSAFISGTPASTTDAEGNAVDPTEEETAAAMAAAKAQADEMAAKIQAGADFNTTAQQYVAEDVKESYADSEYNHRTNALGSSVTSLTYGSWLTDTARKAGDVGVVEDSAGGYTVVMLENRWRAEDIYNTVDVRHILVKAAIDEGAEAPNAEQLAAAKAKVEEIQKEFEAGAKTADRFAELANQYSEDPGSNTKGGLYSDVARNEMFSGFNDWMFAPGRQVGDVDIVENPQSGQQGYHLIYMDKLGEVYWKAQSVDALSSKQYEEWYEGVAEGYTATQATGMGSIG